MVKQTIEIFARIKPTKSKTGAYEVDTGNENGPLLCFTVPKDAADGLVNNKKENYKFMFQKVFDQSTKQEEVFENVARPVVDNVICGYNGTIFAYGQTGSGKTFTITGGPERYTDRGIIPRTLGYIFEQYEKMPEREFSTHISYLEIYNESGYDLLDPKHEAAKLEDLPKVSLMEDDNQNIHLKNLSTHPAASEEEALNLLFLGDTNRMIAETPMNQASTRSHCIFTIHLTSRESGSATVRRSKLHLVDLAGSERVSKTGVNGVLLTEAKYINLSLHYLEQVIVALSEKSRQHIPYRNSMMTSVLRDSLGGNCMTTMIATCSVEKRNIDESISTCRFAQRVAMIKNDALLNEEMDPQLLVEKLRQEIAQLKEELALATGRQHSDPLSAEEVEQCEKVVEDYLRDENPDAILNIGADMRKIRLCYTIMKRKVAELSSPAAELMHAATGDVVPAAAPITGLLEGRDVKRLQELLLQRDSEINILVSMLKKEKKRVADAAAAAVAASQVSAVDAMSGADNSLGSARSSTKAVPATLKSHRSRERPSSDEPQRSHRQHDVAAGLQRAAAELDTVARPKSSHRLLHISTESTKKILGDLSVGRAEAFEIFRRDYEGNASIEDSKRILKQRFVEAKALGEQVNRARTNINKLKVQLEHYRVQRAMNASQRMAQTEENPHEDVVEDRMRETMEMEKLAYKEKFSHLRSLKTEIEHVQHLLENSKVRLMKDFELWWAEQSMSSAASEQRMPSSAPSAALAPADARSAWRTPPPPPSTATSLVPSSAADMGALSRKLASPEVRSRDGRLLSTINGDTFVKTPDIDSAAETGGARLPSQPIVRPISRSSNASETVSLTGDARADADIMAFLRARQSVVQKANQKQPA